MPNLLLEKQYSGEIVAGIDEVGRGAWAGPLVAGACIVKEGFPVEGIDDSKKINSTKREKLSNMIKQNHLSSIGSVSTSEINEVGLSKATYIAIARAIDLLPVKPTILLIDGNYTYDFGIKTQNIPKGDSKSISIAAASIVAKVYRDNLMTQLSFNYPDYRWDKNVGYGTQSHIDGLLTSGVSKHHRVNYKPIKKILIDIPLG
jgi:ribonuclease HII